MTLTFAGITAGIRLAGMVPNAAVTVAALQIHGPESATLTYRTAEGNVAQRLISASFCTRPSGRGSPRDCAPFGRARCSYRQHCAGTELGR